MPDLLAIENLRAGYGEAVVLPNISLRLSEGEVLAVLGRNGTGKTTLINSVVGVTRRFSGTVVLGGRDIWRQQPDWNDIYQHRARLAFNDFDWEDDKPLEVPTKDLIVYEAHVRGFTASPTSRVGAPGTFAGLREKIPYLKSLGVNCIELLPIYEFDEW